MTIKEFAHKYNVPYHIVYEATYKVHCISTLQKDRDYPEGDLFTETEKILNTRMKKHRALYRQAKENIINLHSAQRKDVMV